MIRDTYEFERRQYIQGLNRTYPRANPVHLPRGDRSMWLVPYVTVMAFAAVVICLTLATKGCDTVRPVPKPAATLSKAQKSELVRQYWERDAARIFK